MTHTSISSTRTTSVLGALLIAIASSCGGGGGGGSVQAPQNLSYAREAALYTLDQPIVANAPSVTGQVTTWSITPALPAGLSLHATTGAVQGTPSALSNLSAHVVRAANSGGFVETTIQLGVVRPNVLALACSTADNALSSFVVDAASGKLTSTGYELAPAGAAGPRALAAHPSGRWAYVGQFTSRHISRFALDAGPGRARALENVVTQGRPEEIALHPSGAALYLFSRQAPHVETFDVDALSGALTSRATLTLGASGLEAMARSNDGRFLWASIVSTGNQSITTLEVDSGTLLPAIVGAPLPTTNKVRSLAVTPNGRFLYGASSESPTSTIDVFTVDTTSGALTKLDSLSVGAFALSIAVDPTGRFLYASISSDDTLRAFQIDPQDGRLTAPTDPQVAVTPTGPRPAAISITEDGEELLVTELNGMELGVYSVDSQSGALTRREAQRTREQPQLLTLVAASKAAAPRAPFVYVGNATSGDVSIFSTAPSTGELTTVESGLPIGGQPANLARHPRGTWMYAADTTNGVARAYAIDPASGELAPIGSPVGAGLQPSAARVEPSGRFLYVSNLGSNNVSVFAINPVNGFLTQSTQHLVGGAPNALEIDASGRFLVLALEQSSALAVFEIDIASGGLAALGAPFTFAGQPSALSVHPSGRFVFACAGDTGELWALALAASDGTLSPLANTTVGLGARAIASHPRGDWLYVAAGGPGVGSVAFCSFDELLGALSNAAHSTAGTQPADLQVEPGGASLYVVNSASNDVTRMALDALSGAPTAASAISAGVGPRSIELLPAYD